MLLGPRYKVCRRLGGNIFDKCQTQKFAVSEARHARSMRRKRAPSDYGKQLLEKQRIRFAYGITERQLRRYVREIARRSGVEPAQALLEKLETRLDNVVYRAGFAASRRQARQLVSHGHIAVDGRKVTIPSFEVREGATVIVREKSKQMPFFTAQREKIATVSAPAWLTVDEGAFATTRKGTPTLESTEMPGDLNALLEFYSR